MKKLSAIDIMKPYQILMNVFADRYYRAKEKGDVEELKKLTDLMNNTHSQSMLQIAKD